MIAADPPSRHALPPRPPAALGYGLAVVLVAVATIVALVIDQLAAVPNLSLVFVLPVVIVAVSFGWGPALAAAAAGVLCYNFFLIEPRFTLRVQDPANLLAMGLLLVVAAIVSALAAQSRQRLMQALQHASDARALQDLARAVTAASGGKAVAAAAAEALGRMFGAPAVVLLCEGETLELAAAAEGAQLSASDLEAARWAMASRLPTRADAYPVDRAMFDFWPVFTPSRRQAVVGVRLAGRAGGRPAEPERLVGIVLGQLAVALDREHFAAQALSARLESERQKLKSDLLAAVSHDLRTPLSTILFALQSLLRFGDAHDAASRAELLTLAETETARLSRLVSDLLDAGRIEADAVTVRPAGAAPADLVASALQRAKAALAGREVVNEVGPEAPAVMIDYSLAETALANVLENAGKYAPPGSRIRVQSSRREGLGVIEVLDEGPGFGGPIEPLFEKFARGAEGDGRPPGAGLGLAIARGFLEAQGGRIAACNRTDRQGALVRLFLPLAGQQSAAA